MLNTKLFLTLITFSLGLFFAKAQDSIRLFSIIKNQYDVERDLKQPFYYNPANRLDYSNLSFTEFKIDYHQDKKNNYRQQYGSGSDGLGISVNSFKKLKANRSIWGSASYQNQTLKSIKWNETLDYDRVAPYVIADSVGGDLKLERYQFSGGISQQINRWTFGLEAAYLAQLGYRDRDPRVQNTTSDLSINLGVNYQFYKNFEVAVFAQLNKYTQNTSVSFVSELGQPLTYQMTGFGYSNYFFNSSGPKAIYEEYGYKIGGQIINKKSKDFYLQASLGQSNNVKSISPTNTYYDASDLESKKYELEAAKFFTLNHHKLGLIVNYNAIIKTGTEYGYTNNTQLIEQIFQRKAYKKEDYITNIKAFYQYNLDKSSISAIPFFSYQETTDRRIYPFTGQKYDSYTIGLEANYQQELSNNQMLSFKPYFSKRTVNKAINALSMDINPTMGAWILQDFQYLTSDNTTFGASLRYDIKLEKLPALFINGQYMTTKIQEKNNNFVQLSLGITF